MYYSIKIIGLCNNGYHVGKKPLICLLAHPLTYVQTLLVKMLIEGALMMSKSYIGLN